MTAHTPGPWKVQLARSGSNRLQVSGPRGEQVALVWRHSPTVTSANKWLIAAAPELLDALQKLLAQSGYSYMNDADLAHEREQGNEAIPAIQAARDAIAKATGASA